MVGALLRKELRVELRTLESVPAMSLFAVTTFVVFHFGLNQSRVDGDLAAGVLWVTLLFAAMLGVNRLFVADEEQGGFDAFLLAPVDRSALLLAKALGAGRCTWWCSSWSRVPAFGAAAARPLARAGAARPARGARCSPTSGIAVIGTLVAALAVRTRARDLLGPLLALPLLVPVVLGGRPGHHAAAGRARTPARSGGAGC